MISVPKKGDMNNIEKLDFENENQKKTAIIIAEILQKTGLSQKQFADRIQVSLASFTNTLRPYYKKVPSKTMLRKIADQLDESERESAYNDLMMAAGYDLQKFPYRYNSTLENMSTERKEAIMLSLVSDLSKLPIQGIVKYDVNTPMGNKYDLSVEYKIREAPIDRWYFEISRRLHASNDIYSRFFYHILSDGADERTKYSLVTETEGVFEKITSMKLPALHLHVSAILYKDDQIIEKHLATGIDYEIIERYGLEID